MLYQNSNKQVHFIWLLHSRGRINQYLKIRIFYDFREEISTSRCYLTYCISLSLGETNFQLSYSHKKGDYQDDNNYELERASYRLEFQAILS